MADEQAKNNENQLKVQKSDYLTPVHWNERWEQGRIKGFHLPHVNELLSEHLHSLINGRKKLRIFVPLCGKSVDMIWLANQGHIVIGVEFSKLAILQFFGENSLEYTATSVDKLVNGELFQNKEGNIMIYKCNLFDLSSDIIGQVDAILDRAAFSAIMPVERQKYRDLMISTMHTHTRYGLILENFDHTIMSGPPYCISPTMLEQIFGDQLNIEKIGEKADSRERWINIGHKYFTNALYILTIK
ncbi:putative thiopurine S-methyltransferase [Saccoglossus kowalevskii]|uniref:thiopurine S-methyltransferase n=1 Tax=Saccoglossus kowalevskii TaxID=10224 RepID=A0ABM0MFC8_SACKO|nr:PREDICTED: thiopurine S-methyltransferase-like [Saccoglossus kowalevskii]